MLDAQSVQPEVPSRREQCLFSTLEPPFVPPPRQKIKKKVQLEQSDSAGKPAGKRVTGRYSANHSGTKAKIEDAKSNKTDRRIDYAQIQKGAVKKLDYSKTNQASTKGLVLDDTLLSVHLPEFSTKELCHTPTFLRWQARSTAAQVKWQASMLQSQKMPWWMLKLQYHRQRHLRVQRGDSIEGNRDASTARRSGSKHVQHAVSAQGRHRVKGRLRWRTICYGCSTPWRHVGCVKRGRGVGSV